MIPNPSFISRLLGRFDSLQNSNLLDGCTKIDVVGKPPNCVQNRFLPAHSSTMPENVSCRNRCLV
jgi:hypothetical protein